MKKSASKNNKSGNDLNIDGGYVSKNHTTGCDTNDVFDYYSLVLQWPNTYENYELLDYFTIHGLWPSRSINVESYPCYCDGGSTVNTFNVNEISPDDLSLMNKYWPSLFNNSENDSFWSHEWNKHGTCANGLSLPSFFHLTLQLRDKFDPFRPLQKFISKKGEIILKSHDEIVNELYGYYGVGVTLGCTSSPSSEYQYLAEISYCLSKLYPFSAFEPGCPESLIRNNNDEVSNCNLNEMIVIPYGINNT